MKNAKHTPGPWIAMYSTRNAGEFKAGQSGSLTACKRMVREAAGSRLRWRQEGDDLAAYKSAEDMADEDKAFARIRPISA